MPQPAQRHGRMETTWDQLGWTTTPSGSKYSKLVMGVTEGDPHIFHVEFPPGARVAAHHHESDYVEVIVRGRQRIGRAWHEEGSVRFVSAKQVYGPILTGDDGATVLLVFRDGRWPAVPARSGDREGFHDEAAVKA